MPIGAKRDGNAYNVRNIIQYYLNKDQIRLMDITQDIYEQRELIPEGMSTSVFIKKVLLDVVPKFLKTVSIEEMESAEVTVKELEAERKEMKMTKKRRNKKGG